MIGTCNLLMYLLRYLEVPEIRYYDYVPITSTKRKRIAPCDIFLKLISSGQGLHFRKGYQINH